MNFDTALEKAVGTCAKPYYTHKRRIERENKQARDYSYLARPERQTLEARLFRLFPAGYDRVSKSSKSGTFTPMTRQLYYEMRRRLQEDGCRNELTDKYHRTVLEK